ncbi:MAG: gfo/Idh/MocA family oxidoreductase, partial [Candidatus Hydrogenedentes bacterium]|nr:gfo/Idh/MocA family oxidoreductase [Candidatus Hydrogenedentota bacterium]
PAWWSLKLGEADQYSVELVMQEGMTKESCPLRSTIKYTFPARGNMAPVVLYWSDGFWGEGDNKKYNVPPRPAGVPEDEDLGGGKNGSLFYGSNGILTSGTYGAESRLLPAAKAQEIKKPEPTIPRVPEEDHYQNWIRACKGEGEACSNFDYSGPFTEMVLLGNLAIRTGRKMDYDAKAGNITNDAEANAMLTKPYRAGFDLPL